MLANIRVPNLFRVTALSVALMLPAAAVALADSPADLQAGADYSFGARTEHTVRAAAASRPAVTVTPRTAVARNDAGSPMSDAGEFRGPQDPLAAGKDASGNFVYWSTGTSVPGSRPPGF